MTGRVLDPNGAPVHHAVICAGVWDEEAGEWIEELESDCYLCFTEPGGHFSFELDEGGPYELYACHLRDGIGSTTLPRIRAGDPPIEGLEIVLERPELSLQGSLLGADGHPLPRARLGVDYWGDPCSPYGYYDEVPVDEYGRFEVACPWGGEWDLSLILGPNVEVRPSVGVHPIEVRLAGAHALIHVVDEGGAPVRTSGPWVHPLRTTPEGLRPSYRGSPRNEDHSLGRAAGGSSWISSDSTGGGLWTAVLRKPGVFVAREWVCGPEKDWHAESIFEVESEGATVELTLELREVTLCGPIEVTFLDETGLPIPTWSGSLRSRLTGLRIDSFTDRGSPWHSCMGTSYNEITCPAGDYALHLEPSPDRYDLPVQASVTVQPMGPNRFTLCSPGIGGRLGLSLQGAFPDKGAWVKIELTPPEGESRSHDVYVNHWCEEVYWAPSPDARFGTDTLLLERGPWTWRLLRDGEERDSGTLHVLAGQGTELELRLGD